jgi:hypothetical protein
MLLEFIREPNEPRTANYLQLCDYCKREFKSTRKDAKFCSSLCRVNANKAKKGISTEKSKKVPQIALKEPKKDKVFRKSTAEWDNMYFDDAYDLKDFLLIEGFIKSKNIVFKGKNKFDLSKIGFKLTILTKPKYQLVLNSLDV